MNEEQQSICDVFLVCADQISKTSDPILAQIISDLTGNSFEEAKKIVALSVDGGMAFILKAIPKIKAEELQQKFEVAISVQSKFSCDFSHYSIRVKARNLDLRLPKKTECKL